MTTFKCRTCGITWQMGPTRDMDHNEQCHCCAREGNGILNARVAELEQENARLRQANRDCCAWFDALNIDHQKALKSLDELARLGNGNAYGNSIGNEIAQQCLNSCIG